MRIAILTTDNREHQRKYQLSAPFFGPAIEALLQGLSGMPDLEIHVISCTQRPMHSPEKLSENIWFHLLHVPKFGWLRTGYQGCVRAIRHRLRDLQPHVVHGQGTERECALAAVFSGFPNVVTVHGIMSQVARVVTGWPAVYYRVAAILERFALSRTLGVFCNSEYTDSIVGRLARRTWRVPNALRTEFFDTPLTAGSKHEEKPVLLNVGTITAYKRQLALLGIAETLHAEGRRFEIKFIGGALSGDRYAREFEDRLAIGVRQGYAMRQEIHSLTELLSAFDTASALIHVPSEESFGLVFAEALARNLKVFASDAGGLPDIARGVENAELFAMQDASRLRKAISNWLENGCPPGIPSQDEMRRRYHPSVVATRHIEIYRQILASTNEKS